MEEKKKKIFTQDQAYKKAADYCAYQERCQQEVRDKLYSLGLHREETEATIAQLISDGFINEERFSKAFAGGKFRIKKWGKIKIKGELKQRNISEYCIRKGLEEIDPGEYIQTLTDIINKKIEENKKGITFAAVNKVALYAISRGFESDMVWDILRNKLEA